MTTEVQLVTPFSCCTTPGVVDTGAARTLISEDIGRSLLGSGYEILAKEAKRKSFKTAADTLVEGYLLPQVEMICQSLVHSLDIYVLPSLPCPVLLGMDFLSEFGLIIDPAQRTVTHSSWPRPVKTRTALNNSEFPSLQELQLPAHFVKPVQDSYRVRLPVGQTILLEPCSEKILTGYVQGLPVLFADRLLSQDVIFTPLSTNAQLPSSVLVGHCVTRVNSTRIPVRFANFSKEWVTLPKHLVVGSITFSEEPLLIAEVEYKNNSVCNQARKKIFWDKFTLPINLSNAELGRLKEVLWDWRDVFSQDSFDLGTFKDVLHEVHTSGPPIRQPIRRQSPHAREETFQLVQDMLAHGIVTPSTSPWASPVVLVKKSDGKTRFCVDYRRLNDVTHKDAYPLPRIDDTLDSLGGCKYFSTLDLTSGYWQIGLTPDAAEKSAFPTQFGLFEFTVLPFGMCNAPGTFQRAMECCLAGLQWEQCMVYLDDVIVFSPSFALHLERLQNVFQRFRSNGLKLKPSKCKFAQEEVKYLGHVVSSAGICPDPLKIDTVKNWPIPRNTKEVQSFIGLASYYRKFIKNFAHIAAPLHKLCSPKVIFKWTPEIGVAFEKLKEALITHPILIYPDFSKPFRLDVDACGVGLGAVLSQEVDGREHVVAYSSRVLQDCETRYPITEKEGLALFNGVKCFKHYLHGRKFTLVSDHDPLRYLRTAKDFSGRIWRWVLFLERFDYTVIHRAGKKHVNADALSRLPMCGRVKKITPVLVVKEPHLAAVPEVEIMSTLPESQLLDYQALDPSLSSVVRILKGEIPLKLPQLNGLRHLPLFHHFSNNQKDYCLEDNLVLFQGRVVIPPSEEQTIFSLCHDQALAGHLGVEKTTRLISRRFFWPGLSRDVRDYIRTCEPCQLRKRNYNKTYSPLQPFVTGRLFQRFAMDIVSYVPVMGYSDVLVVIDYSTRWPEAFPLRDATAATIAGVLYKNIVCRYGVPEVIHSDRGPAFQSQLLVELYALCGITRTRTTAYHPQGDGLVERQIQTLSDTLSKLGATSTDWLENLSSALFAVRVTPQASTGYSPYELLYGREPLLPADVQFGHLAGGPDFQFRSIAQLQTSFRKVRQLALENIENAGLRQKEWYDAQHRKVGDPFQLGDLVYTSRVHLGRHTKLDNRWDGPYEVVGRLSSGVWLLRTGGSKVVTSWAQDRLKLCCTRQPSVPIVDPIVETSAVARPPEDHFVLEDDIFVDCVEVQPVVEQPEVIPEVPPNSANNSTRSSTWGKTVDHLSRSSQLVHVGSGAYSEPESAGNSCDESEIIVVTRHSTPVSPQHDLPLIDLTPIPYKETTSESREETPSELELSSGVPAPPGVESVVLPSEDSDPNVTILSGLGPTQYLLNQSLGVVSENPQSIELRRGERIRHVPERYGQVEGVPQRVNPVRTRNPPDRLGVACGIPSDDNTPFDTFAAFYSAFYNASRRVFEER